MADTHRQGRGGGGGLPKIFCIENRPQFRDPVLYFAATSRGLKMGCQMASCSKPTDDDGQTLATSRWQWSTAHGTPFHCVAVGQQVNSIGCLLPLVSHVRPMVCLVAPEPGAHYPRLCSVLRLFFLSSGLLRTCGRWAAHYMSSTRVISCSRCPPSCCPLHLRFSFLMRVQIASSVALNDQDAEQC